MESDLFIARRDVRKAADSIDTNHPKILAAERMNKKIVRLNSELSGARAERDAAHRARADAILSTAGFKAASISKSFIVKELTGRLSATTIRADAAAGRAAKSLETVAKLGGDLAELQNVLNKTAENVSKLHASSELAESRVAELLKEANRNELVVSTPPPLPSPPLHGW
jgi:hypothetical protein